ncbi:glycosyltransferase [Desulfovibrio psychrotolerans]|nr:glycosyltransferase [Desulfovibrio psychrotolerans]
MVDLPVLKSLGKTVIARQCGSEVRDTELAQIFWQAHGSEYPNYEQDRQTPPADCSSEYNVFGLDRYHPTFANKLHTTRMAEMYADSIISGPPSQTLGIRPYFQTGPIFDVRDFSFKVPRRQAPVIVHAPSNMRFKRSDIILDCLQQLRDDGVHFHLKVLRNMPHEVIRAELAEADILIDQLSCGCGTLAYEGMASGCVVLGGHKDAASPLPRNRPVTHISVSTIKETVRQVIQDLPLRIRLAASAREYINDGYGSPASVAEYMLQSIERAGKNDCDLYPVLFTANADAIAHEPCPEYLREMTRLIFLNHGTHESTDVTRLVAAGLVSPTENTEVPRWDNNSLQEEGPWVLTGKKATYGRTV